MANEIYNLEDFFETTLSDDLNSSDTTIPLTAVPSDVTKGYLVVEPNSSTKREVIHFTSVGGSSVTAADDTTDGSDASGRGCEGSITTGANTSHDQGATVIIAAVKQYWDRTQNAFEAEHTSAGVHKETWIPADESWSYSSWDDTNGVSTAEITVPSGAQNKYGKGMRVKFTQPTDGVKYGIITKVVSTTLTVFIDTDYDFDNEAITSPFYSSMYAPHGFNADPNKYTVEVTSKATDGQSSPSSATWYNPGSNSIDVPVGKWRVSYNASIFGVDASATQLWVQATLSTANNSESDDDFTVEIRLEGASGNLVIASLAHREKSLTFGSKTTYYLNVRTTQSGYGQIGFLGANGKTILRATSVWV